MVAVGVCVLFLLHCVMQWTLMLCQLQYKEWWHSAADCVNQICIGMHSTPCSPLLTPVQFMIACRLVDHDELHVTTTLWCSGEEHTYTTVHRRGWCESCAMKEWCLCQMLYFKVQREEHYATDKKCSQLAGMDCLPLIPRCLPILFGEGIYSNIGYFLLLVGMLLLHFRIVCHLLVNDAWPSSHSVKV